jgi:hypothetical protein
LSGREGLGSSLPPAELDAVKFGMEDAKGITTPMSTSGSLDSDKSDNMVDQKLYRSMIGSLLYVTTSRHDVMFSVCMCARF